MKINDNQIPSSIQPVVATNASAGGGVPPGSPTLAPDRVTTDEAHHLRSSVVREVTMAAGERAMRLQALSLSIVSGTYRPDPARLADQILTEARFDAKLAQSLG
jgi:hypothetical protein